MTATDQMLWLNGEPYSSAKRFGFADGGVFIAELVPPIASDGETVTVSLTLSKRETRERIGGTAARATLDAPHRLTIFDDFGTPHEVAGETGFIARLSDELRAQGLVGPERAIHRFGDYRTELKYVPGPGAEIFRIISSKTVGPWARSKALAWKGYKRKRKGQPMPHEELMRRQLAPV
jgi:hypothetical protein